MCERKASLYFYWLHGFPATFLAFIDSRFKTNRIQKKMTRKVLRIATLGVRTPTP
jgi:hypothetical protein